MPRLQSKVPDCFPWLKRAVGPGFFVGDAIMLGLAFEGLGSINHWPTALETT